MRKILYTFFIVLLVGSSLQAGEPTTRQWTVDGIQREALIFTPASTKTDPSPIIFAFHGHGGNSNQFSRVTFQTEWPEAIVVYPQGLPTPGRLVDKEGKLPGWQAMPGEQGDRDLKFFDAMFEDLKKDFKIDPKRVYATGHSNGGTFTYVLWRTRGEEFTAFAPASTAFPAFLQKPEAEIELPKVALRPVLHIAGKNDPLVKFAWQERTMDIVRKVNQCSDKSPEPWAADCTLFPSPAGAPVVTWIHDGGHELPPHVRVNIVKFFKEFPAAKAP